MTKLEEQELKFILFSDGEFIREQDFELHKKALKISRQALSLLFNYTSPIDINCIDELNYQLYFEWFLEYHKILHDKYFELMTNLSKVSYEHFNENKTYTSKELKDLFIEYKLGNVFLGFGGAEK